MSNKLDIVTGDYFPVTNPKTKKQIVTKEGRKWQIVAYLPRQYGDERRPRKYHNIHGSERYAQRETQKFITQLNEELNESYIPNDFSIDTAKINFGDYLQTWLQNSKRRLKTKTWESYCMIANRHILPLMGHIPLNKVTPYHISTYKEKKLSEDLDLSTVNKHLTVISGTLEDAALPEKRLIPYNPATLVRRAKGGNRNMAAVNCLDAEELNNLLSRLSVLYSMRGAKKTTEVIEKLKYLGFTDKETKSPKALHKLKTAQLYPIVYLAAKTGMRLSELLALKWNDIDFNKKEILVVRSSHYGKKEGKESSQHYNTTKEGIPKSYIDITEKDIEFLKQHKKEQAKQRLFYSDRYYNNNLIFARKNGTHFRNDTVSGCFSEFAKTNGFSITFHGLRHTHLTFLAAARVPMMYVARRAGHFKVSTTHDFYSHAEKTTGFHLGEIFEHTMKSGEISPEEIEITRPKIVKILNQIGS